MSTTRNIFMINIGLLLMLTTSHVVAGPEYFGASPEYPIMNKKQQVVVMGAYRCPGDFSGFQHSIVFTASDLGNLNIETEFANLDTGDCTPRGQNAQDLAQDIGCTTGPLYAFQRGGGAGAAFNFVCKGKKDRMVNVIKKLSDEILRPTQ